MSSREEQFLSTVTALSAVVLTTILESEEPTPLGPIFLALNASQGLPLGAFEELITALRAMGLTTNTSETISLTPNGRRLALELEQEIEARIRARNAHLN